MKKAIQLRKATLLSRKKGRSKLPVDPTFVIVPPIIFAVWVACMLHVMSLDSRLLGWWQGPSVGVTSLGSLLKWWEGPSVNKPLPFPKIVDAYMTETSSYRERLWGSYR